MKTIFLCILYALTNQMVPTLPLNFINMYPEHNRLLAPTVTQLGDDKITLGRFINVLYKGKWTSTRKTQNDFILEDNGTILMAFGDSMIDSKNLEFEFLMYQGYYVEDRYMVTHFNLTLTDNKQTIMDGESDKAKMIKVEHIFSNKGEDICKLKGHVELYENGKPVSITTNITQDLLIKGTVTSENCDFDINFELAEISIELLSINFFVVLQIFAIITGFYPFFKAYRNEDLTEVNNLSDMTLLLNIAVDMITLSLNLTFSMRILQEYFEFLSLITMFLFTSFIFKMKTYVTLFEMRIFAQNINNDQLSRLKFNFLLKFLGTCIICSIFSNFLIVYYKWFILLAFYPIFQIVHNSYNVIRKNCFKFHVHVAFILPQFAYVLGFRSLNFSMFQLRQDYKFGIIVISILIAQLMMMYFQKLFGPAFYLPKFLIPNYFNYMRKLKDLENAEGQNCPICFTSLSEIPEHDASNDTKLLPTKFMETPCQHRYHESCLKSWMEQKLICPCCRASIPPY